MYAYPAWWGYSNSGKIEQLSNRMRCCGFLPPLGRSVSAGLTAEPLFKAKCSNDPYHVLRHHFPLPRDSTYKYNLRPRPHPFTLPDRDDQNFNARVLHNVTEKGILTFSSIHAHYHCSN